MNEDILNNMTARVELCRLLARETTDARTSRALTRMADEGQADVERLFAVVKCVEQRRF